MTTLDPSRQVAADAKLRDNPVARLDRMLMMRLAAGRYPERRQTGAWDWLELIDPAEVPPALAAVLVEVTAVEVDTGQPPRKPAPQRSFVCSECGETFNARRAHAIYCTSACRAAAKRKRNQQETPVWQRRALKRSRR